jgi:hypothetical protein
MVTAVNAMFFKELEPTIGHVLPGIGGDISSVLGRSIHSGFAGQRSDI